MDTSHSDSNSNSNNNNYNNNKTMSSEFHSGTHELFTTTIKNLGATASHPLQDIPFSDSNENISEMQQQQQQQHELQKHQKIQSKENWVKFDDEVNETNGNNLNNNNNHDRTDSSSAVTSTTILAANKLLSTSPTQATTGLLPPPPASAHTRPRTPIESTKAVTPETDVIDMNAATTTTPLQRTNVSASTKTLPDVAPAVLTTESTHVNLNASGKAQHHSQQQLQQQQSVSQQRHSQQQQPNKPHGAPSAGSADSHQQIQTHHSKLPMHHSQQQHQQQQQQHLYQQQHNSSNGISTSMSGMHHKMPTPHVATIPVEAITTTAATTATPAASSSTSPTSTVPAMRTIELSTGRIREGFANGDVIVTLLPANTKWPWITPAIFRPELVPEELMAQGLTLTVEEYVQAMETLVNDYRFTVYNVCYKRILVCWILFAFTVLLTLLFSGLQGIALFSLGVTWLFLNAAAIFVCMWIKLRLSRGLEKCLARVNRQLMKHKILLILDDRGRISCHKVNLCFMYFDATQCVNYLNEFLEQTEQNGGEAIKAGWESKLDIDVNDIVIQGSSPVRLSRKQERGMQLFLRYGSRWGMEALRGIVEVTPFDPARHCGQFQCPCQYIKEHLQCKPRVAINRLGQIIWTRTSYPV